MLKSDFLRCKPTSDVPDIAFPSQRNAAMLLKNGTEEPFAPRIPYTIKMETRKLFRVF